MVAVHQTLLFLRRPWSAFFLAVCVVIVATMMLPSLFGMQKFTQWGAMYTDSWCQVRVYDKDPGKNSDAKSLNVLGGTTNTRPVWSAPMHNPESCAMYARNVLCGQPSADGWTVVWAQPYFKGKYYLDPVNACTLNPGKYPWFVPAPYVR